MVFRISLRGSLARTVSDWTSNRISEQTPRTRSCNAEGGLSRPRRSTMAIPKGCPSEERVASEKAGSVEVVTTPGEHQDPENCHTRYPGGRHHSHATLPHVILRQHKDRKPSLFVIGTPSRCGSGWIRVFLLAEVSVVCAHRGVRFNSNDYHFCWKSRNGSRASSQSNMRSGKTSNIDVCDQRWWKNQR